MWEVYSRLTVQNRFRGIDRFSVKHTLFEKVISYVFSKFGYFYFRHELQYKTVITVLPVTLLTAECIVARQQVPVKLITPSALWVVP